MEYPVVVISDRAKRRIKQKHPWIFSNEITRKASVQPGDLVRLEMENGEFVGIGYFNPHTLIAVRILSHRQAAFDLAESIEKAILWRKQYYDARFSRLIFGESDNLPGLIVDCYQDTLVMQVLTAGMEKVTKEIAKILVEKTGCTRILLKNDTSYRQLEGLPINVKWIHGDAIKEQVLEVDGVRLLIDFSGGQKTGFFLDQQENRRRLLHFAAGESMLDAFSYTGAWSVYGAKAGMKRIVAVDSSNEALEIARRNAELNDFPLTTIQSDLFDFLKECYETEERFDVVVLDPPAFAKSRRHLSRAMKGYHEINLRAMKLLRPGGILFSCSCSQPVSPDIFHEMLQRAATDSGRRFRLLEMRSQPIDHPVVLHFPESQYLKCAVLQVM